MAVMHRYLAALLAMVVLLAAQRAREISGGAELTIDRDRDKNPVVALREIAEETVTPAHLKESVIGSMQRVLPEDDDEVDEIGSLSELMKWDLEDVDAYLGLLEMKQAMKAAVNTYQMRDVGKDGSS